MPIRVEQDDRVRATGSVLLLTDMIDMNDSWKRPEIKALSLGHVAPYRDHTCARIARQLDPCASMGSSFYCYAVLLEGPDRGFEPKPEAASFTGKHRDFGFHRLLRDFYRDTDLAGFWQETTALWEETLADCRAMLAEEDPGWFLDLFYGETGRDLVVVPNPLNPASFSYGPGMAAFAVANHPVAFWLTAGSTWHFQTWYRDTAGPCGTGANVSNAATVTFVP